MTPHLVVDVGNSRVKFGLCANGALVASASLPSHESAAWDEQIAGWNLSGPLRWALATVQPHTASRLVDWLQRRGDTAVQLREARQLSLTVALSKPDHVGIDRLLDAVAANVRRPARTPAIIVDAGSAVTVDVVNADGAFLGGSIFPGLRLMAQALHDHTALLPLVVIDQPLPPLPGTSTPEAIAAGVYWATAGGISTLVRQLGIDLAASSGRAPIVYVTGGDAAVLAPALPSPFELCPELTLEGIHRAAESLA